MWFFQPLNSNWTVAFRHGPACAGSHIPASYDHLPNLHLNVLPSLKQQEIPLDHPDSCNMFRPGPDKPFVATPAAVELYSREVIIACWQILRRQACCSIR